MKDVLVILLTLGFFAVCVAYVALCDRIVGPDDEVGTATDGTARDVGAASGVVARPACTADRVGGAR